VHGSALGIKARCDQEGVRFEVVIIPSKEMVFAPLVAVDVIGEGAWSDLVRNESEARGELTRAMQAAGIAVRDALPEIRRRVFQGEPLYRASKDAHLSPQGYAVLAELIGDALAKPAVIDGEGVRDHG